ncbi:MAG: helix-turn-helix domain-containing protein [Micromonosporaceae bacterium]|nr:helix-turn-helix domain-containing protein [Micromonosporaceae bacterium]
MNRDADNTKRPTTLRTAERALAFLEAVAQAPHPPRVKEVATQLGLNFTTGYHILNTLQQAGYLTRAPDGTLRIGGRAAVLYQGLLRHFVLGRDLHPVIEKLAATTEETAYLCTHSGNGVVVQTVVEGTHAVRVAGLYVGFSGSEHLRAAGKAVLAFLPDPERSAMLARSMKDLPSHDRSRLTAELDAELEQTRQRGFALDDGNFDEGVRCVAAPFFAPGESVAGAVSISLPAARYPRPPDQLADAVRAAAREVSAFLGHHDPQR